MMKVAAVSISLNEERRLNQWVELFSEYKNDLSYHIIVDNHSDINCFEKVKSSFPDSIIIRLDRNYGFNKAHNIGIQYALEHTDADAILYIGTDFKLSNQCIPVLYKYLYSDSKLGIVFPVEIDQSTSKVVNFGHIIKGTTITKYLEGESYQSIEALEQYIDMIEGGCHMMSRNYAMIAGLYDESLFMYADEIETTYKAQDNGIKLGVTGKGFCQHRHINTATGKNTRHPFSMYLIARNGVYLAAKYRGKKYGYFWFLNNSVKKSILHLGKGILTLDKYYIRCAQYAILGGINGLKGNLKENKYSLPNY